MKNILSVDLEDWYQSSYDRSASISNVVIDNTKKLLDLFGRQDVRATFFCQGLVAEKFPDLIKEIHSQGHEITSHGWSHISVKELGPDKFKSEIIRTKNLLEEICSEKIIGYRAPDFSIDLDLKWAFEILQEAGIKYDSSLYPISGKRYGSPECKLAPFKMKSGLWELPLSTVDLWGHRWPVLGGGYFRLYPYVLSKYFIREINAENRPAILYIHPYEINPDELDNLQVDWKTKFHQGLFRNRVSNRLEHVLSEFSFTSAKEWLNVYQKR